MSGTLSTVATQAKYGLQIKKPVNSVFKRKILKPVDDEDDLDSDGNEHDGLTDVQRVNQALEAKAKVALKSLNNTSDDIYDYDSFVDSRQNQSSATPAVSARLVQAPPKATYVHNLKSAATIREHEHDRLFEKKLLKERQAVEADGNVNNEIKFVTSAYKKKLVESQKWEREDK
jgi:hypothetical protein